MKKIIIKLFAIIIIINFIGIINRYFIDRNKNTSVNCIADKDRLQVIKEKGIFTVASANDPPFFYINATTKKLTGVDADIIAEIAKRLGINKIEMKQRPFAYLLNQLCSDNTIDLAANGIYITPEREEVVKFTHPLYKESEAVIVPKASKINFIDDLKNAVVGAERGTAFADLLQQWNKNGIVKDVAIFNNMNELLGAINNGEVDAGVADSVVINYFILNNNNLFLRTLQDYAPKLHGVIGIAVKKNDTELLNALNEKINEMKADGTLYAILIDNGLDKSNMI